MLTFFRLLWHYGFDLIRLRMLVNDMLASFSSIYRLQAAGRTFDSPHEFLTQLTPDMSSLLNVTLEEHLRISGFNDIFVDELITAAQLCNYGQLPRDINAFVGLVSLAGMVPDLWSTKGGNGRIVEELVNVSQVRLIKAKVTAIESESDGRFQVIAFDANQNVPNDVIDAYDAVVFAIPMVSSNLNLSIPSVDLAVHVGQYEQVVATFVRGSPRPSAWDSATVPDTVLVVEPQLLYHSLGQLLPVDWTVDDQRPVANDRVWKLFSNQSLTVDQLDELFETIVEEKHVQWSAYPHYDRANVPKKPNFVLGHHLYHVNAIEWAASAMEMSALGGRNVALLLLKDFNLIDPENKQADKQEL